MGQRDCAAYIGQRAVGDRDDLIGRYEHAVAAGEYHPVLLSGLVILDLLVVRPFEDGGRVARLLTGHVPPRRHQGGIARCQ